MSIERLSGGLTPADGADPRTFPTIFNDAADIIEANQSDIDALEGKNIPAFGTATPSDGQVLTYDSASSEYVPEDPTGGGGALSGNAIINGDFGVWQRGTSFASLASNAYSADRWKHFVDGSGSTYTVSRQSFTPGDLEVIGYGDAEYFLRYDVSSTGSETFRFLDQPIEDVRTLAGQQVTISFWAKANASRNLTAAWIQFFGSGGSGDVGTPAGTAALTTSWQRFSFSLNVPSVSGKTIGSGSYAYPRFNFGVGAFTVDIWGVQVEAGPTATPFRLAGGGSKAAELALCQRYYQKLNQGLFSRLGTGFSSSTTSATFILHLPQTLRAAAASVEFASLGWFDGVGGNTISAVVLSSTGTDSSTVIVTTTGLTSYRPVGLTVSGGGGFIAFSAEL